MIYLVLIVFGLCLGSFVNALVWRLHAQAEIANKAEQGKKLSKADKQRLSRLSISRGRSMCLSCGHELAGKDLIPVVSWLMLRGKCRYCGARIPDTPLAELLVPSVFVVSYAWWPYSLQTGLEKGLFVVWLACAVAFVALALYDLRWFLLPDRVVFPLIGLSVLFIVLRALVADNPAATIGSAALGVLILAGLFFALHHFSDGKWIGFGDVKLALALGLLAGTGINALILLLFASILGVAAGLPGLLKHNLVMTSKIPFGPFLLIAACIVVLWGGSLSHWYLNTLIY
jgi:leader peptidase (prepilin peptidase)/N-methyltransferase